MGTARRRTLAGQPNPAGGVSSPALSFFRIQSKAAAIRPEPERRLSAAASSVISSFLAIHSRRALSCASVTSLSSSARSARASAELNRRPMTNTAPPATVSSVRMPTIAHIILGRPAGARSRRACTRCT
uniref:Uncharacterized protein n=1 Tax=uncultured marine virus TaxID=186617 RepID=A0A0F7L2A3_9VIRU|nr:hypothetical protein [uncultured marine virus]